MGKETIRVSFPVPQSGVQASPLLQRLRGLLPAGHQVLQRRLAALLFRRQAQQLLIVARSSGQRLLELRRLVLLRGDLPLEPDVYKRQLEDYDGTLIFVSHDRYFVDKFATRIWELSDGTIRDFPCGYAKYRAILEHEAAARQRPAQPKKEKQAKPVSGSKELEKLCLLYTSRCV